jgi:hypothetical protein
MGSMRRHQRGEGLDRYGGKTISPDCDLGHLKGDGAAVANNLRADPDQLFLQDRQRPVLDRLGRRQRSRMRRGGVRSSRSLLSGIFSRLLPALFNG